MLDVKDLYVSYGQSEALHGISFEAHKNDGRAAHQIRPDQGGW